MKVSELMERVGSEETGRVVAYLKDALEEMNMSSPEHIMSVRIDINENQRFYDLPADYVKILDIRAKNHLNNRDEYQGLPRMIGEPATEDKADTTTGYTEHEVDPGTGV